MKYRQYDGRRQRHRGHYLRCQDGSIGVMLSTRRRAVSYAREMNMTVLDNQIWHREAMATEDSSAFSINRLKFIAASSGEAITAQRTLTLKGAGCLTVVDAIAAILDAPPTITGDTPDCVMIIGAVDGKPVMALVQPNDARSPRSWEDRESEDVDYARARNRINHIKVMLTSDRKTISHVYDALDVSVTPISIAEVKWWYRGDHGVSNKSIFLEPLTTRMCPEFYPDLGDPEAFLNEYLAADQSILLVAGPPGTGKTTLLRYLICNHKLAAHVVYDETLMNDDSVFQNFLFETRSDIMVIEDADTILMAREDAQNKLMARFLNVSDGLIKLPNKKLVFTTNISDFGKVDQALLRPGRCFDVLHTRTLNLTEAQAAARIAGVPIPTERAEYTLAELFNQHRKPHKSIRKVGFR
jgi:hypothetical protein